MRREVRRRGETLVEDGKAGDAVGAVRSVRSPGRHIRQRLLAHSDLERSYSYEFADAIPFPVTGFRATIRITPVVDSGKAFVEWWATFDCAAGEIERWTRFFEQDGFARWLGALRRRLAPSGGPRG